MVRTQGRLRAVWMAVLGRATTMGRATTLWREAVAGRMASLGLVAVLGLAVALPLAAQEPKGSGTDADRAAAIEELTHALKHQPGDPHLWMRRAAALLRAGRVDEALRDLDRAAELDPRLAATTRSGDEAGAEGRPGGDATTPEADPADADGYLRRASRLLMAGRVDEAIRDLEAARDLDPDLEETPGDADGYLTRAARLLQAGRADAALRDLERALELNPRLETLDDADEYVRRASALLASGRAHDALVDLESARRIDPSLEVPGLRTTLPTVYPHQGVTAAGGAGRARGESASSGDFVLKFYVVRAGGDAGADAGPSLSAELARGLAGLEDFAPRGRWRLGGIGLLRLQERASGSILVDGTAGSFEINVFADATPPDGASVRLSQVDVRQWPARPTTGGPAQPPRQVLHTAVRLRDGETAVVGVASLANENATLAVVVKCEFVRD